MSGELTLDLPLAGTRLIEASAGTGKTWTIAGLYLRLLVERRLSVREILVVTYTRAATEELKDRLRTRLGQCADLAQARLSADTATPGNDAESVFADALIARALEGGESVLELARRLRLAAVSMDEAAIHTIHAFCQRALREQAFTAGEPLEPAELIGSDRDLAEQIAADFWRRHASAPTLAADFEVLADKLRSARNLAALLLQVGDPDLLVRPAPQGADTATQMDLIAATQAAEAAGPLLCDAWTAHGEQDRKQVFAHADHLNQQTHKPDKIAVWYAECGERFALGTLPARATLERIGAAHLATRIKKSRPPLPPLAFAAAVDAWLAADMALVAARAARWPALLANARRYAADQLEGRKQRAARQSYDDLIRRLHDALVDPAHGAQLALALHARCPVALVDEFQDTDARQFEIFRRIYADRDGAALILVGDPKQAIYRFRGGDIHAYLRAASQALSIDRLQRNFRSSPGLLKAIEAVYAQAGPERAFADPRILFHPVEAGGIAADDDVLIDGTAVTPMTVWHLPDAEAKPNKDEGRAQLAHGCAEAIAHLLRKGRDGAASVFVHSTKQRIALAPHHLAVLVSTNDEAGLMQAALATRGVASATIRQDSVFATAEAADLLALLGALESRDEAQLRAALATRLLGFDAEGIAALLDPAQPQRWLQQLARLDELDRIWRQHGVLALCERVFETRAPGLLGGVAGERHMTNYLQLADLLQQASAHQFSASGLIDWLRRRIAQADERNEDEQLRLESDGDRVQIATIHASKGLEYDLVFLPFMALRPGRRKQTPATLIWHEDDHRVAWVRAVGDAQSDSADFAAQAAEQEELAERMRVLYVALTRARHACWLSWDAIGSGGGVPALAQLWHAGVTPEKSATARAALDRLVRSAPAFVKSEPLPLPGDERIDAVDALELPRARTFRGRIDTSWWVHSFSQLRDGERAGLTDAAGADDEAGLDEALVDEDATASEVPDWPRGERFGTALHEILEHADFAAWRGHASALPPAVEQERIALLLQRHALAPPRREAELLRVVTRMLAATLNARLPGDLALADLVPTQRRAELPFHFAIGGASPERLIALLREHGYQQRRADFARVHGRIAGLMTGIIDLVYRQAGRWWIVDYKTNWLGPRRAGYAGAALAAAVRDHDYDLQYLIYTLALHRWLRSRLGERYDYERDLGGAVYLFVRGLAADGSAGVHVDRPPCALIEALDALFAAEVQR